MVISVQCVRHRFFTIKVLEKSSLDSQDSARVEASDKIFCVEINRVFVEHSFKVVRNLKMSK